MDIMLDKILTELTAQSKKIAPSQLVNLTNIITESEHIFLAGAGRSGIMISAFANRLMHLGLKVSLVNEITKPRANKGDLLIIGSGSGETPSLLAYSHKAKQLGLKIALITMKPQSTLAKLADVVVCLPSKVYQYPQPMGSTFEQLSLLVYDNIILMLVDKLNQTFESMQYRHANIE